MRRLPWLMLLLATTAFAADRHVYLDTDGDGQLNDCPNPAHNAQGTSNTNELSYCVSGTSAGKIIGTATGRVASATCTTGGGTVTNVTNAVSSDVDGDGTNEVVYGHPQACVWNMTTSDSCDVHSGTYRASGAYADSNSQDQGMGAVAGCDKHSCWFATVLAPGPASGAYGTAVAPAYLRAANSNSSIDSWDPNLDKNPSDSSYPVIFSGDRDNDATFDITTGSDSDNDGSFTGLGANFRGDASTGVVVGCQRTTTTGYSWCGTGHNDNPWIDTDADGDFDTRGNIGNRTPDHFIIKDIEFSGYNGGNGATEGVRFLGGIMTLGGNRSTDGLIVDHVYVHGNDYSYEPGEENFWAIFDDQQNYDCATYTDIKNSHLEQNNEKVSDNDCGVGNECGCPIHFHDNKVVQNITSSVPEAKRRGVVAFFYFKSIDTVNSGTRTKAMRIYNNEFIIGSNTVDGPYSSDKFMDLQAFGNSIGNGQGELWVYGNVFRLMGSKKMNRFWLSSCGIGTGSGRLYFFNNTFDMTFNTNDDTGGIYVVCGSSVLERVVEKNNAYFSGTTSINTHATPATTAVRASELCTVTDTDCTVPSSVGRTDWFAGTPSTLYDGIAALAARASGPLNSTGSCDPDGDGTVGVDYDGNGSNDTTWTDIAGNLVSCPTIGTAIDVGAIQNSAGVTQTCGNDVREGTEVCDDTNGDGVDFGSDSCEARGFAGGFLTCTSCTTVTAENCTTAGLSRSILRGVTVTGGSIK